MTIHYPFIDREDNDRDIFNLRKTHNKDLRFVKSDWSGNLLDSKSRYKNLDGHSSRGFKDVFKWKFRQKNKYDAQRKGQKTNVEVIKNTDFLDKSVAGISWLGHASFAISIGGLNIITDPVLYNVWPLKRFTELPCDADDLKGFDCILLSHNHRDHADKASMKKITDLNPNAIIYTGLEIADLLKGWGIKNKIVEAGWYQQYPDLPNNVEITYLPAKHWNRRLLNDLNQMLWGSFMISHKGKNIYFGADSGLGEHFEEIGNMYDIHTAILGIGAYEPIWFMYPSHTSPADALVAKDRLKSDNLIPMHYGTFDLSDEPIFNPKAELERLAIDRKDIQILSVGEKWRI